MNIYQRFHFNRFDRQQLLDRSLLVLFFFALAYRIYACFQVPLDTTDVLRNLGYASHAMDNSFAIYNTKGIDFRPEIWTFLPWENLTFQYPPVTLIFFYIFSILGLGIFWVKLTLTLIELTCAYLFYKRISKVAAILFFCAPVSLWFTSHEGQFEPLLTIFIILNVIAVKDKHWRIAGFLFAISIQVKQFGILIAPWMLYEMWRGQSSDSFIYILRKVTQGVVVGFVPFLAYYLQKPDLLLIPFLTMSGIAGASNSFSWNFLDSRGLLPIYLPPLFNFAPLIILLLVVISERRKVRTIVSFVPLASFFIVMKSLKVLRPWYFIVSPGFLFCFSQRKKLICLLLIIHLMRTPDITRKILGKVDSYHEPPKNVYIMESCMFNCNVNQKFPLMNYKK
jgi:hypothetical protein